MSGVQPVAAAATNWATEGTSELGVDLQGPLTIDSLTRINGRLNNGFYGYAKAGDWSLGVLWATALTFPNGVYGEIGFRNGISATAFALAAKETSGKVYSMDIDVCETGVSNIKEFGLDGYHTFIQCDSRYTDFPEPLDVLYIDGAHTYEGVKADYERHAGNVREGGVIFFHDPMTWPTGVGQFLIERNIFFLPIGCGLGIQWKPFERAQSIRPEHQSETVKVDAG
jgi:hypothetical protein